MRLFGLEITRTKAAVPAIDGGMAFPYPPGGGSGRGWFPIIREGFPGAWQRNMPQRRDNLLAHWAVWACNQLIAGDIGKLRPKVIQLQDSGIWQEAQNSAYSPVLRDPNPYQNSNQFFENWILSKLLHGNAYVLKRRDAANIVRSLYVLDVGKVRPLVAPDGAVFYQLGADEISGIDEDVTVPAREIIHDRWNTIFHPLVGVSPLFAAAHAAGQGLRIQTNATSFFENAAQPSGLLVAPTSIDEATATRLEEAFQENYGGGNAGRIAVVGDGLQFQRIGMTSVDAQLIEQLRLTAEMIGTIYNIPHYKLGLGHLPPGSGVEPLNMEYYSQCLQKLIEHLETCLDRGLNLPSNVGVELDLDGLFRMDTATKMTALRTATEGSIMAPNEARAKLDLPPVPGGDQPFIQQQYWPVGVMANRPPPTPPQPASNEPTLTPPPPAPNEPPQPQPDEQVGSLSPEFFKGLGERIRRNAIIDERKAA